MTTEDGLDSPEVAGAAWYRLAVARAVALPQRGQRSLLVAAADRQAVVSGGRYWGNRDIVKC